MADDKVLPYTLGANLKKVRNVTQYDLFKGVTDFSAFEQFNNFESGYQFFFVCKIPKFLEKLTEKSDYYKSLISIYTHILENEFKGLDGLDDITTETLDISNGVNSVNLIGKVTKQSASTISMRYTEKSGSILTRVNKLYLTGVRDPDTQIKTYHGLLATGDMEDAGPEYEVFSFLHIVTDNTGRNLEQATLLVGAFPTKAETSIYNGERGSIEHKEVTMEFNCIPLTGEAIDAAAVDVIKAMNTVGSQYYREFNSNNFKYKGIDDMPKNVE
ncbi:MAG: hypothetical protein ACRCXT_18255 [Paraclostridium sp.]